MQKFKKTILIDLDGVLNDYKGGYDKEVIPELKAGAREFLERLYRTEEYEFVLFTTRNLLLVSRWLVENKIDGYFSNITNVKIPAYLIIDDRALCFEGEFEGLLDRINNFKVHWKV